MRHLTLVPERFRSGAVIYRGPSRLDGKTPIIAILTGLDGSSSNPKTGPMAQLWILVEGEPPTTAQRSGADAAVCGDCPLRPLLARAAKTTECYVVAHQATLATWKSRREDPVDLERALGLLRASRLPLRLGAYGDPAALPRNLVEALGDAASSTTGYTHQWRSWRAFWLRRWAMASVSSAAEAIDATLRGWRTFRILPDHETPLVKGEIRCPAQTRGVTCAKCRLCDGSVDRLDLRKDIAIVAH